MGGRVAKEEIHWVFTASTAPECAKLEGTVDVDVLVIGAGLTGCRTALGLADAGVSVAMVDSKGIGWGASGRSGGQCNPIWRQTPQELVERLGARHGETLIKTTLTAADDLFSDIRKYDVDCDAVQAGWVQAAHTRRAARNMSALGKAWAAAGADIVELDRDAVRAASGSPAYSFALRHAAGGHVQPLSLTRGYARTAAAKGAQLFKDTRMTSLERVNGKWLARSDKGEISAENVVLTTNAYTNDVWPGLRKTFLPLVSNIMATVPLSDTQQQEILPGKVTISDSRLAIFYSRYDRDGRLIFGCVGSSDTVDNLGDFARLRRGLKTVFPQLADIPIFRKWAGPHRRNARDDAPSSRTRARRPSRDRLQWPWHRDDVGDGPRIVGQTSRNLRRRPSFSDCSDHPASVSWADPPAHPARGPGDDDKGPVRHVDRRHLLSKSVPTPLTPRHFPDPGRRPSLSALARHRGGKHLN